MNSNERVNTESKTFTKTVAQAQAIANSTGSTQFIFAADRNDFCIMDSAEFKGCAVSGIVRKVRPTFDGVVILGA